MRNVVILVDPNPRVAIACVRALKDADVHLYLCSNNNLSKLAFSKYCKRIFNYNADSAEDILKSLLNIKNSIGAFTILPNGQKVTRNILQNKKILEDEGISIASVGLEEYDLMSNKEEFIIKCNEFNIEVPKDITKEITNQIMSGNFDFEYNFVIKPKSEEKSEGQLLSPYLVENKQSFDSIDFYSLDLSKHFFQEYINGPSVYYCGYYRNGINVANFVQKNLVQQPGGKSVIKAIESIIKESEKDKIDAMMTELGWNGVMMIELKYDERKDKYYAIECNPRLWGPLQLAVDNGVNFPAYLLEIDSIKEGKKQDVGYLWVNGFAIGALLGFKFKSRFQRFSDNEKIKYRDVWFRKDTCLYGLLEVWNFFFKNVFKTRNG